jgi:hypothetical protein
MNDPVAPADQARRAWRLLRIVGGGLVALAALIIALIAAGAFDPRPFGRLWRTDRPGVRALSATGTTAYPQPVPWPDSAPPKRYSVRLRGAWVDGQADVGYGLALGDEAGRLVVAVSPLGYASVWQEIGGETTVIVPWQPWPHIRLGPEENELWLDVETAGGHARVAARINRELLWQGEVERSSPRVELWLSSFDGPATVDFRVLEWFATPDEQP